MSFPSKTGAIHKRGSQTLSITASVMIVMSSLVACKDAPPTETVSEKASTPEASVPSVPAVSEEARPEVISKSKAEPEKASSAALVSAKEKPKEGVETTESPKASAPVAVTPPKVKFPEMKMSDKALAVRKLFVEANKQFKEKRYVGAIQTIRKLDAMELSEKEEQAVDLFLKRIEKALSEGSGTTAESSEKE